MNNLSTRQWRLDTPAAYGTANALLWPTNLLVRQMEFMDYAAQGAQAVIKDRNGVTVWSPTGAADLSPVRLGHIGWVNGLVLDTLASGIVVVYLG